MRQTPRVLRADLGQFPPEKRDQRGHVVLSSVRNPGGNGFVDEAAFVKTVETEGFGQG